VGRRALHLAFVLPGLLVVGCGGTSVFDAPDPTACGDGHGCPMAACSCNDGSIVLDTTCVLGECRDVAEICDAGCEGLDGVASVFATEGDSVAIGNCDQICARVEINGCELGCDTLFSECLPATTCSQTAAAFWNCVANDAVLSCRDNSVRVEGCTPVSGEFAVCE
jgi:hypothetical protein